LKLSKEILKSLVELITEITGKGQEEISLAAGYSKTSITSILSKGVVSPKMVEKIELTFKEELKKTTYFEDKIARVENKDVKSTSKVKEASADKTYKLTDIRELLVDRAISNVTRREVAKLMAKVYEKPLEKVLDELHQSDVLELDEVRKRK